MKQRKFFPNHSLEHGGVLRRTRKGRGARPLTTRDTLHFVFRSSQAVGARAFNRPQNRHQVAKILGKFASRHGIQILSPGISTNHFHLHIRLSHRAGYKPFIRAVTAAIAMAITGASRWKKLKEKFWDFRPYSRVVIGRRAYKIMEEYMDINDLEGKGFSRETARWIVGKERGG